MKNPLKSSRQRIALSFALLSSIVLFSGAFGTMLLVEKKIEDQAKNILQKSVELLKKDYEGDQVEETRVVFQESQIANASVSADIAPTESAEADSVLEEEAILDRGDAYGIADDLEDREQGQGNIVLQNAYDEDFNVRKKELKSEETENAAEFKDIEEDVTEENAFDPTEHQIFSRIIEVDGDVIVSSDLFEEYAVDPFLEGFSTFSHGDLCIYVFSEELMDGEKAGSRIQAAQYCSFPKRTQKELFQLLLLSTFGLIVLAYFLGLFGARVFLLPLEKALEKTKAFAQNCYHELLTPVTVMLSTLAIGERKKELLSTDSLKEDLLSIKTTLETLSTQALLEQQSLLQEKIDLVPLLQKELRTLDGAPFPLEIKLPKSCEKKAHETAMKLVFRNILSNIKKYAEAGKPVKILMSETGIFFENATEVEVEQEAFTQRGHRGNNGNKAEGNGIGMHIVRDLVTAHHWTLRIETKEKKVKIWMDF